MAPSSRKTKKRKRDVNRKDVVLRCLACSIYKPNKRKTYTGTLYPDTNNRFFRVRSSGLNKHITRRSECHCFNYYNSCNLIHEDPRGYHIDFHSSMVRGDSDINANTAVSVSQQDALGVRHGEHAANNFNRSINNQMIPIPVQNIDKRPVDSLLERNFPENNCLDVGEDMDQVTLMPDIDTDSDDEDDLELETVLETDSDPVTTNLSSLTIDSNAASFNTPSDPRLLVELELMNIMTEHKMPHTAFKSIFDWAKRSQNRPNFDFEDSLTATRTRKTIMKQIRKYTHDEKIDEV